MKSTQKKVNGVTGHWSVVIDSKTRNRWFPSITLGLLTTVLGMVGIVRVANADELPEQPNSELDKTVTEQSQTNNVSPQDENLLGQQQEPANRESPILNPSSATTELGAAEETTDKSISLDQPADLTAHRQETEVSVSNTNLANAANAALSEAMPVRVSEAPPKEERAQANPEVSGLDTPCCTNAETGDRIQETEEVGDKDTGTQRHEEISTKLSLSPRLPLWASSSQSPIPSPPQSHYPLSPPGKFPNSPTEKVSQNNAPPAAPVVSLAPNEVRILTPQTGITASRTTNLVVQYNADAQIQVSINQKPLDPSTSTQQERNQTENSITQVWYNIPLEKGENTLTAQAGNGTPASAQLTVNETPVQKIELTAVGDPRVPADGRSTLTLQGRITDEKGELITEEAVVTLTTGAGNFVGADQDKDQPGFQVLAQAGEFTAQLQSGLQAQKVRIRAALDLKATERLQAPDSGRSEANPQPLNLQSSNLQPSTPIEAYTQVEFITNLRPSLVSGVVSLRIGAAGTNFWGSRSEFLNPDTIGDGTQIDLNGAVFATGRMGEWLFTGAYNSSRPLNETCDGTTRLFRGPQFCEQNYPVYGDSSTVDYLTPSTDSVYLRFERTSPVPGAEPDYVMWGDYSTQELARTSQVFTATTRQLHGFKGNYNFGNLQLTALYSRDIEGFQRDTIAPNGTSGYYFLSRRLVVPGSENVFIETEENNRPGTVIERKPFRRGTDYEIDYDRGTLLFRRAILATEFNPFATSTSEISEGPTLLVRRIVVTYQYDNAEGDDTSLYAGRLQYNFSQDFNSESWVGATYLREDQGIQDFELYGADFRLPLGQKGQLIGEYAHSSNDSLFQGNLSGSAYRFEANAGIIPGLNGRAYYRSVEEGFTNNATTSFTPGQTRYGAALTSQLGPSTRLQVGYDYEENFGTAPAIRTDFFDLFNPAPEPIPGTRVDNELTTIRAGIQQQIGVATLGLDYVHRSREDRVSDVFDGDASQIVSRAAIPLSQALTFRAQNELNLGDDDPLYPSRTTFGLDWGVYPGVTLRLAHQFFDGGLLGSDSITSFDTILEHQLGENTSITGRYSVLSGFNTITGQGAVGLNHRWVISPGLRVNLGYEHTFSNSFRPTAAGVRFAQPYAVGQSASSLALLGGDVYSVGVEYTDSPDFKASARIEHRSGSGNNNTVFSIAGAGKISPALTALARYEQANFANQLIEGLGDTATLRLGLAYRDPNSDRWNALARYEYRKNPATIPDTLLLGSGTGSNEHVFALEAIYAPNWRWEFYGKGALRHSTTDLANNFTNSSTIFLSQLRASYRLGYRMDLAVEGRWIGQSSPGFTETGFALETGYYLTPDLRLAVGYSFGSADDRDFTGYRSNDGPYVGLTFKVNELFGGFGRQRVVPPQQQESRVEPLATGEKPASTSAVNATSAGE
jgi:hypothetical protein